MNKLITITLVGLFLLSVANAKDSNNATAPVLLTTTLPTTTTGLRLNLTTTAHVESLTTTQTILVTSTHVVSKGVEHEHDGHEQHAKEMLKTLDNHNFSSKLTFNLFSIIAVLIVHLF
jgi:hypothetical protein